MKALLATLSLITCLTLYFSFGTREDTKQNPPAKTHSPIIQTSGDSVAGSSATVGLQVTAIPEGKANQGPVASRPTGQQPTSFENAADLFAFAMSAGDSSSPDILVQGYEAAKLCIAVKADWEKSLAPLISVNQSDPLKQLQAASVKAIRDRCAGFLRNDRAGNSSIRARIVEQARLNEVLYLSSTASPAISASQFKFAVDSNNVLIASSASSEVIRRAIEKHSITGFKAQASFASAFLVSLCDLGLDCDGNSASYHWQCARLGNCNGSLLGVYQAQASAFDIEAFSRFREQIIHAWRSRDLLYFGFST
jgi:hypothetical protein